MKRISENIKYLLLCLLMIGATNISFGKILLPQILSNDMVLQRDKPITIWGFGAVGEQVTVTFAGQTRKTVTDQQGKWEVQLSPLKTSSVPQQMVIVGTNKIILNNILVGEVWLCSGQSNMEYAMRKLAKIPKPKNEKLGFPSDEVAKANNDKIRIFLVNRKQLIKPDSIHKSWSVAKDSALRSFSAVGYFYAKELQQKLGIPIGVISSAVPGSAIEPWVTRSALEEEDFFKGQKIGNDPGKFYTPMIEPLTKFKVRGFLWYQGETNCFLDERVAYSYKMKAMINLWRKAWDEKDAPFYYVQIAPFNYSTQKGEKVLSKYTEPEFWEAQAQVLRLPNTAIVVTTDLNDSGEDLHPTYKWEVGRRLSLHALAKDYGKKVNFTGPVYKSVSFKSNTAIVTFDHLNMTLKLGNQKPVFMGFEVAGADGKFYPADAFPMENAPSQIWMSVPAVEKPVYVRYNWTENPHGNLTNETGLPTLPFRTNNPLIDQFKPNTK